MAVEGFNHYNLRAPRALLDDLRDFYCNVVGLQQGARPAFRSYGYWLYAGKHDILHLSECPLEEKRAVHVQTTFDHVAFSCSDYQGAVARLNSLKVKFGTREVPATGVRQIFFSDPAGNGVEFNFSIEN